MYNECNHVTVEISRQTIKRTVYEKMLKPYEVNLRNHYMLFYQLRHHRKEKTETFKKKKKTDNKMAIINNRRLTRWTLEQHSKI